MAEDGGKKKPERLMNATSPEYGPDRWDLRRISTQWSVIENANLFVLRYSDAIEEYLRCLLHHESDVEDVFQLFLVKVLEKGFDRVSPDRGRFRNYLIRAVKNEVIDWQRAKTRQKTIPIDLDAELAETGSSRQWDDRWQACMLDRSWKQLRQHELEHPGNCCYSVLQAATEHRGTSSEELAARVSLETSQVMNAAAFRKQLSRARRLFAEFLVLEVAETIDDPTPASVQSELRELGLMSFIENHLPESWK